MPTIGFVPDLFDLGHQHVVWSTDLRLPVQDVVSGANVYGPADVFQDAAGNVYRVSIPDGSVQSLNQQFSPPVSLQPQPSGNQIQGGQPSVRAGLVAAANTQAGAQTGAAVAGGLGGIGRSLGTPFRVGNMVLPVWFYLAALGGGYYMLRGKRGRR